MHFKSMQLIVYFILCPRASSMSTSLVTLLPHRLSQLVRVIIQSYTMSKLFNENVICYQAKSCMFYMSKQHSELLWVKTELMSTT